MPKRLELDRRDVLALLHDRERVLTHAELVDAGVPLSTVCKRIRRAGPWQRLHPGVVLAHTGTATRRERLLGALAYAGEGAMLTGASALRVYGVREVAAADEVHVLVPHERRRQSRPGLTIERTRALPPPRLRRGLRLAPPARAVVDACRAMSRLDSVRALVADVVQSGLVSVDELVEALAQAARQRSGLPREVLAEVAAGVRSAAEAQVRDMFDRHGIPQPKWNWSLHTVDGEHVATPDGYWEAIGAAMQIDSMMWHLSPSAYRRTQQRARALGAYGVPVLPVAPGDALANELAFIREVRSFLARNADRAHPVDLVLRPPADRSDRRSAPA
jgi:hypothetical protein